MINYSNIISEINALLATQCYCNNEYTLKDSINHSDLSDLICYYVTSNEDEQRFYELLAITFYDDYESICDFVSDLDLTRLHDNAIESILNNHIYESITLS